MTQPTFVEREPWPPILIDIHGDDPHEDLEGTLPARLINHAIGKSYTITGAPGALFDERDGAFIDLGSDADWQTGRVGVLNNGQRGLVDNDPEIQSSFSSWYWEYLGWLSQEFTVKFDLDQSESVYEIAMFGVFDAAGGPILPPSIRVETSQDDSIWTTEVDATSLTQEPTPALDDGSRWIATYSLNVAARYWKVTFGDPSGGAEWVFLSEVELWGPA